MDILDHIIISKINFTGYLKKKNIFLELNSWFQCNNNKLQISLEIGFLKKDGPTSS